MRTRSDFILLCVSHYVVSGFEINIGNSVSRNSERIGAGNKHWIGSDPGCANEHNEKIITTGEQVRVVFIIHAHMCIMGELKIGGIYSDQWSSATVPVGYTSTQESTKPYQSASSSSHVDSSHMARLHLSKPHRLRCYST